MNIKVRLALMNFIEFAVWGAYLTSMGNYLGKAGMGAEISWFYAIQGVVSIFMPTLIGIVADNISSLNVCWVCVIFLQEFRCVVCSGWDRPLVSQMNPCLWLFIPLVLLSICLPWHCPIRWHLQY